MKELHKALMHELNKTAKTVSKIEDFKENGGTVEVSFKNEGDFACLCFAAHFGSKILKKHEDETTETIKEQNQKVLAISKLLGEIAEQSTGITITFTKNED